MNSSSYMDKQITELSSPNPSLLNLEDDQDHAFNFHPIRPLQSLSKSLDAAPVNRGWSSMDQIDSAKFSADRVGSSADNELISRIEQKLKEHADVLLHSMECLSARVSQIETRTRQVENSVDELKEAVEVNHGKINGKLMDLGNVLTEVHSSVKDMMDKQEIAETQLLLAKLQVSKNEKQPETQSSTVNQSSTTQAIPSQQPNQPPPVPAVFPQPALPTSSAIPNVLPHSYPPTPAGTPSQLPAVAATAPQMPSFPQQEPFHPVSITTPGSTHQPYMPPSHQSRPRPQPYQPPPHFTPNIQLPQAPQPFLHPEELPYLQSHGIQKSSQPQERPPQQYFNMNSPQRNYDQMSNLRYPESKPSGYGNSMDYHYNSPTHSGSSPMRSFQAAPVMGGEMGYSRLPAAHELPAARELPRAIPTASSVDSSSSRLNASESGNRVPIDDVIDKVVAMGFRRDLVRATVNKLTENGQHVDLNVVLDKLMNS